MLILCWLSACPQEGLWPAAETAGLGEPLVADLFSVSPSLAAICLATVLMDRCASSLPAVEAGVR